MTFSELYYGWCSVCKLIANKRIINYHNFNKDKVFDGEDIYSRILFNINYIIIKHIK